MLSESIHLMAAILVHFEDSPGEREKENFLSKFIFKGLEMENQFDFFKFSLECYLMIIQTYQSNPPRLLEVMEKLYTIMR